MRVRPNDLVRLGEKKLAIVVKQTVERLQNLRTMHIVLKRAVGPDNDRAPAQRGLVMIGD